MTVAWVPPLGPRDLGAATSLLGRFVGDAEKLRAGVKVDSAEPGGIDQRRVDGRDHAGLVCRLQDVAGRLVVLVGLVGEVLVEDGGVLDVELFTATRGQQHGGGVPHQVGGDMMWSAVQVVAVQPVAMASPVATAPTR